MHCNFKDLFFVAKWPGVLRTFTRFFRKWFWQELIFGMTTMVLGLGKPSPGQKLAFFLIQLLIMKILEGKAHFKSTVLIIR